MSTVDFLSALVGVYDCVNPEDRVEYESYPESGYSYDDADEANNHVCYAFPDLAIVDLS